jgi:potassium-dependent mechanosensitive channel
LNSWLVAAFPTPVAPFRRVVSLLALVVLFIAFCQVSSAQSTAATGPAEVASPEPIERSALTRDEVEKLKNRLDAAKDLTPEQRTRGADAGTAALEALAKKAEWEVRASELAAFKKNGPGQVTALRKDLDASRFSVRVEIASGTPLSRAEPMLLEVENDLKAARQRNSDLDREVSDKNVRRLELPKLLADVRHRREEAGQPVTVANGEPPTVGALVRALRAAQSLRDAELIKALELEVETFDVRLELLRLQREQVSRRVSDLEYREKVYRAYVNDTRRLEAEREAARAREAVGEAATSLPQVKVLAQEVSFYADRRTTIAARLASESEEVSRHTRLLEKIREDYKSVREKIRATGFTDTIGLLLRVKRADLPPLGPITVRLNRRRQEISHAQLELIELNEKLAATPGTDAMLAEILTGVDLPPQPERRRAVETTIRNLLRERRRAMEGLVTDVTALFTRLVDFEALDTQLERTVREYSGFIDERVLWIRSCSPIGLADLPRVMRGLHWMFRPSNWWDVVASVGKNLKASPIIWGLIIIVLGLLFPLRARGRQSLEALARNCFRASTDRFQHTLEAAAVTVIYSAYWVLVLFVFATLLTFSGIEPPFVRAFAGALRNVLPVLFGLKLLKNLFLDHGLALAHFNWRFEEGFVVLRRRLGMTMMLTLPVFFFYLLARSQGTEGIEDSLGRLFFVFGLVLIGFCLQPLVQPDGVFITSLARFYNAQLIYRLRYVGYFLAVILPVGMALSASFGYFYTAERLFERGLVSTAFLLMLLLAYSITYRALFVHRRRLALAQALERRAALAAAAEAATAEAGSVGSGPAVSSGSGEPGSSGSAVREVSTGSAAKEIDISAVSSQTQSLLSTATVILLILGLWGIWVEVLPAIRILNRVQLWTVEAKVIETITAPDGAAVRQTVEKLETITLSNLILALIILFVTVSASRNIPGLLEFSLLQKLPLDAGMRFAVRTIASYLITLVGVVFAFGEIGIGWGQVQWLVAAVSVGLGFGLQEIFANFVSGLIILFERPMRVGDVVTIGEVSGTVTKIEIRATTVTDWNRKELIVPNKEFITGRLINWTLSDTTQRVVFKVGVAYGTDTDLVHQTLLRVAKESPFVMTDPPCQAVFMGFGESSLDFELRVFIPSLENYGTLIHTVNTAIDKAFKLAGIEIPFPQRDLHLRSLNPALERLVAAQVKPEPAKGGSAS